MLQEVSRLNATCALLTDYYRKQFCISVRQKTNQNIYSSVFKKKWGKGLWEEIWAVLWVKI